MRDSLTHEAEKMEKIMVFYLYYYYIYCNFAHQKKFFLNLKLLPIYMVVNRPVHFSLISIKHSSKRKLIDIPRIIIVLYIYSLYGREIGIK